MFSFESINKTRMFDVDNTNFVTHTTTRRDGTVREDDPYWSCAEMYKMKGADYVYRILGVYFNDLTENKNNRSDFQPLTPYSGAIAIEDRYVSVPSFQAEEVKAILANPAAVETIKSGRAGFQIEEYRNKWGTNYKIIWRDYQP